MKYLKSWKKQWKRRKDRMTRDEFIKKYTEVVLLAVQYSEKARKGGLLALEKELDQKKIDERDIFHLGLRLVLDRIDKGILEKILSNIVKQEKDEYTAILKNIQKEAVLSIQEDLNTRLLYLLLDSHTDLTSEEQDEVENKILKD
jgi:flagellar motor component MotA